VWSPKWENEESKFLKFETIDVFCVKYTFQPKNAVSYSGLPELAPEPHGELLSPDSSFVESKKFLKFYYG